jgi:hypothetical protein
MSALLELLRALPEVDGRTASLLVPSRADELIASARRHGLSALVRHTLDALGVEWPSPQRGELIKDALQIAGTAMKVKRELVQVLDALAAVQVSPILLKGYGFASRYYPSASTRPMTDIDLYVGESDLEKAGAALQKLGFIPEGKPQQAYELEHHHHWAFTGQSVNVELHFRLITGFKGAIDAPSRSVDGALDDARAARFLTAEDELTYLSAHAASHLFVRLNWLYDIKLLISRNAIDVARVVELAEQARLTTPIYAALYLAQTRLRAAVRDDLLEALAPPLAQRTWISQWFTDARLDDPPHAGHKYYDFLLQTSLASTGTQAAEFVFHHARRTARRRIAKYFPQWAPDQWRG